MKTLEQTIIAQAEAQLRQEIFEALSPLSTYAWWADVPELRTAEGHRVSTQDIVNILRTHFFKFHREKAIETALKQFVNQHLPKPSL